MIYFFYTVERSYRCRILSCRYLFHKIFITEGINKEPMRHNFIFCLVTSNFPQLNLWHWNCAGRSWVFLVTSVKTDLHVFSLFLKADKYILCLWTTNMKHTRRWQYDCMVASSLTHYLFLHGTFEHLFYI